MYSIALLILVIFAFILYQSKWKVINFTDFYEGLTLRFIGFLYYFPVFYSMAFGLFFFVLFDFCDLMTLEKYRPGIL